MTSRLLTATLLLFSGLLIAPHATGRRRHRHARRRAGST